MAGQTGTNAYLAFKAEPVSIGVPDATVTGAAKFLINRMQAPALTQATIRPGGIFSDGQRRRPRGGSHSANFSVIGDLAYGDHDAMLQAAVRGTYATDVLTPGVPLVRRSYTFEVYEADIDRTTLTKGGRVAGFIQRGAPDQPITHEYPIVGITQQLLASGASPFYTSPTAPSDDYMTAADAAIEIDGVAAATVTGWEVNLANGMRVVPIVGTKFSPDVYDGLLGLTGSITLLRDTANISVQQSYLDNTPMDLQVTASDEEGNMYEFLYGNLFITSFTQALGDDGPETVTANFEGGKEGANAIVQITRTAAA